MNHPTAISLPDGGGRGNYLMKLINKYPYDEGDDAPKITWWQRLDVAATIFGWIIVPIIIVVSLLCWLVLKCAG